MFHNRTASIVSQTAADMRSIGSLNSRHPSWFHL